MLLAIGIVVGLLLGLTGAGGSVFAVPLLTLAAGLPIDVAMGLSLGAVSVGALSGSIATLRARSYFAWPAILLVTSGFLTAPMGRILAAKIDGTVLMLMFSVLSLVIAGWMWMSATKRPGNSYVVRAGSAEPEMENAMLCPLSQSGVFQLRPNCVLALLLAGSVVGFLSGLFGVGGGFLIVPILLSFSGMSMSLAVGTSLLVITVVSGVGFVAFVALSEGAVHHDFLTIIIGSVIGMLLSRTIAKFIAGPNLQKLFSAVLVLVSLFVIWDRVL